MSLMGTLGKVAMGVMIAKGVGKMMSSSSGGSTGGGGLGGLLGGLTGGQSGSSSGGLGGLLGGLTGSSSAAGGSSAGGLGGLLGGLTGQSGSSGSGLGGLIDSLGGNPGQATPFGTNAANTQSSSGTKDFGDLFNSALQGEEPEVNEADEQNAKLMLRAMISAAKADGNLDSDEQAKITEHLQDASDEEIEFVRQELQAPIDMEGMIRDVPAGMEKQVYLMSLLGISLDTKEEAIYLDNLAQGLNISHEESNQIHDQLGAPKLYS